MADEHRRFQDAGGNGWEIRAEHDFKWQFLPMEGNDSTRKIVTPHPEADDPFDLSDEELQRLLQSGIPTQGISEPIAAK